MEIIVCTLIIVCSGIIWHKFDIKEYESVAASFSNMNVLNSNFEVSDYSDYVLYQTSDADALKNIEPIVLSYDSKLSETFLVIQKNSTLDYHSLKINYDDHYIDIDACIKEEADAYYIKLGTNNAGIHRLIFWINSDSDYDTFNKSLSFSFENNLKQDL